jgi:hypothetical protein
MDSMSEAMAYDPEDPDFDDMEDGFDGIDPDGYDFNWEHMHEEENMGGYDELPTPGGEATGGDGIVGGDIAAGLETGPLGNKIEEVERTAGCEVGTAQTFLTKYPHPLLNISNCSPSNLPS